MLKVKPRRGAALLFYSYLPNGNFDDRMDHGACPVRTGHVDKIIGQVFRVIFATAWSHELVFTMKYVVCPSFGSTPFLSSKNRNIPLTATSSTGSIAVMQMAMSKIWAQRTTNSTVSIDEPYKKTTIRTLPFSHYALHTTTYYVSRWAMFR